MLPYSGKEASSGGGLQWWRPTLVSYTQDYISKPTNVEFCTISTTHQMILQMSKSATGDHQRWSNSSRFFWCEVLKEGVYIFVKPSSSKNDMLRFPSFDS